MGWGRDLRHRPVGDSWNSPASPRPRSEEQTLAPQGLLWLPRAAPAHCTPHLPALPLPWGNPRRLPGLGQKRRSRPPFCKATSVQQVQGPGVQPACQPTRRWTGWGGAGRRSAGQRRVSALPPGATTVLCLDRQARPATGSRQDLFACVPPGKGCEGRGMRSTHLCISKLECLRVGIY